MRLYVLNGCPFGHRAAIALREKKLDFELTFFEVGKRPPELEAVGPRAKSPTLFDGDFRVHDSGVVLEYLEDRYSEPRLLPVDPAGRAKVRMMVTRINEELGPKYGAIVGEVFKPHRNHEALEAAQKALHAEITKWEGVFEERRFLGGDELTIADIIFYTPIVALRGLVGFEVSKDHTHLRAWLERMHARPTFQVPR